MEFCHVEFLMFGEGEKDSDVAVGIFTDILCFSYGAVAGNGLLPDGPKPLPGPMLTYHQ